MSYAVFYSYDVWCPGEDETEEDAVSVKAISAGLAAIAWLKARNDEAHYTDLDERTLVKVKAPNGVLTTWDASATVTTSYSATPAEAS